MDTLNNRENNHANNGVGAPAPSDEIGLRLGSCDIDTKNAHVYNDTNYDGDWTELHGEL